MTALLKDTFKQPIPDAGEDCVVNYVWINKSVDCPDRAAACTVPLKHLDEACKNATKYPAAKVKIWFDNRFLDDRSRQTLAAYHKQFAPNNITFCDLNDVSGYGGNAFFDPVADHDIWRRVDLARLLVLDHVLRTEPEKNAIYADFDVDDVVIERAKTLLQAQGFALATREEDGQMENSYFAFNSEAELAAAFLKSLIARTSERVMGGDDGWGALLEETAQWRYQFNDGFGIKVLPHIVYGGGHKIPDQPRYQVLGWNP